MPYRRMYGGIYQPICLASAYDLFYHDHTGVCERAAHAQLEPALGQGWLQKAVMVQQELSSCLPGGCKRGKPELRRSLHSVSHQTGCAEEKE